MIFDSSNFIFSAAPAVARARRVLIKPFAQSATHYPENTGKALIRAIVEGIRRVSDADILILEGASDAKPVYDIYRALEYDFPRVLMLDVKDCIWVEVENPLPHPYVISTFWVPNVVLSSDYLISITPLKIKRNYSILTIENLLSLLPIAKYQVNGEPGLESLSKMGISKVIADLYFTLPFDLGIVDATVMASYSFGTESGIIEEYGKIFIGEPYEIDKEVAGEFKLNLEFLDLIETGKSQLEN